LKEVEPGCSAAQNIDAICFSPNGLLTTEFPHLYRLANEFSLFYLKWMASQRRRGEGTWLKLRGTPAWRVWSGYAFENVCHRHLPRMKHALGIAGVETTHGCWLHRPTAQVDEGAQIDLLIDRRDDVINVCEMKFADDEFVIDEQYARDLQRKLDVFRRATRTRKSLFLTMVTTFGVRKYAYASDLVASEITMQDLF
jgi:uncharacterized protein